MLIITSNLENHKMSQIMIILSSLNRRKNIFLHS